MKQLIGFDQHGQKYILRTSHPRKELLAILGRKHADKIYIDKKDNSIQHVGYIIAGLWINIYELREWKEAKL